MVVPILMEYILWHRCLMAPQKPEAPPLFGDPARWLCHHRQKRLPFLSPKVVHSVRQSQVMAPDKNPKVHTIEWSIKEFKLVTGMSPDNCMQVWGKFMLSRALRSPVWSPWKTGELDEWSHKTAILATKRGARIIPARIFPARIIPAASQVLGEAKNTLRAGG